MPAGTLTLISRGSGKHKKVPRLNKFKTVTLSTKSTKMSGKAKQKAKQKVLRNKVVGGQAGMGVFPDRIRGKMVYSYSGGLTAAATQSVFGNAVDFYLNAITAPKVTSPDYRVQGWDQIAAIYGKYKVSGCLVEVLFHNCTVDGMVLGIRELQQGETDYIDAETVNIATMKKNTWYNSIENTGSQKVRYKKYLSIQAIEGLSKLQFESDIEKYSSVITAIPTYKPVIQLACANTANTTQSQVAFTVKLTYYTTFYDRQFFSPSIYA